MRDAALRVAEQTLLERPLVGMSAFETFLAVLAEPVKPVPELQELARRAAPWDPGHVCKS